MKKFKNYTLDKYLDVLASKEPVPGGGSASALAAALGAGLISMAARYSLGRKQSPTVEKRIQRILKKSEQIRRRLLELVDLDAQAYLRVVKTRKSSSKARRQAQQASHKIPQEIGRLCYQAVELAPFLVAQGNPYLVSDVQAAVEILSGAFNASKVF